MEDGFFTGLTHTLTIEKSSGVMGVPQVLQLVASITDRGYSVKSTDKAIMNRQMDRERTSLSGR